MLKTLSWMFAIGALAACASQNGAAPDDGGHGSGSGSGSDAGSGSDGSGGSGSDGSGSGGSGASAPIGSLYGAVLDERADAIDFSSGEPVHTHGGAAIDLSTGDGGSGSDCPAVYKYAYFEDAADPEYGLATTPNPLEWHVTPQLANVVAASTQFRVRTPSGATILDWTAAPAPDETGVYTVRLYRDGGNSAPSIAQLGDYTGDLAIDVRFSDSNGDQVIDSACWENHPLAAPLEVSAFGSDSMFQYSLPADSPISPLMNAASLTDGTGSGMDVYMQPIAQPTAESVTLHVHYAPFTAMFTSTSVVTYVVADVKGVDMSCIGCSDATAPAPVASMVSGTIDTTNAGVLLRIVDGTTGAIICHNADDPHAFNPDLECTLPPRMAGEAPHPYALVVSLGGASAMMSPMAATYSEYTVGLAAYNSLTSYTGTAPVADAFEGCPHVVANECSDYTFWSKIEALDKATVSFSAIDFTLQTATDATAGLEPATYVPPANLAVPAATWDAGDKLLAE